MLTHVKLHCEAVFLYCCFSTMCVHVFDIYLIMDLHHVLLSAPNPFLLLFIKLLRFSQLLTQFSQLLLQHILITAA